MLDKLLELDRDFFLYLNGFHTSWLDPAMLLITQTLAWLPLYIFLLFLIIRDYGKQSWMILLGIGITILLADQVTSGLMKPYFARLRPSHDPSLQAWVHIVNGYKGGKYGFASGHSANTFGTATFFFLLFGKKRKWMVLLFLWAAIMTYSRIYLGVHYPGDILVGGIVGFLSGLAGFKLFQGVKKFYPQEKKGSAERSQ